MDFEDRYFKLRPPGPTPPEELCACEEMGPVKLMAGLGYNPLHCVECNLEVPPERLGFGADLAEALSFWRLTYNALYGLWLDSRDYEELALSELADLESSVNRAGRGLRKEVEPFRRCFYQGFEDQSVDDWVPLRDCPACDHPLRPVPDTPQQVCEECSLLLWGSR